MVTIVWYMTSRSLAEIYQSFGRGSLPVSSSLPYSLYFNVSHPKTTISTLLQISKLLQTDIHKICNVSVAKTPGWGPAMTTSDVLPYLITGIQETALCQNNWIQSDRNHKKILIFSRSDGIIYAPAMFVQTTARRTRKNCIFQVRLR